MTDIDDQALAEPETQETEAAPEAASPAPETPPEYPWSREHPEWGPEDQHKAYNELRSFVSSGQHKQPEPEPEPESILAQIPRSSSPTDEYFYDWANQGSSELAEAAQTAIANVGKEGITERLANELYQAWYAQRPIQAQRFVLEMHAYEWQQQMRAEMQQEYQPAVQHTQHQMLGYSFHLATAQRPDLADKKQQQAIVEFCEANPYLLNGATTSDPQGLAQRLVYARDLLIGQQTKGQFAPPAGDQPADDTAKTKAATTKSRGASTADGGGLSDVEESILRSAKRVR